jgi:uncharacterized OB-fold protein
MTELIAQGVGIPLPIPSVVSKPFWDACADGYLAYQRCTNCKEPTFEPNAICRFCGQEKLKWERSNGRGSVYSWSVVWRPQSKEFQTPYAVAIVELDEGFFMLSNIVGCESSQLSVGMPVEVTFNSVGDGIWLPYFRPRD